jgi:cyclin H
MCDYASSTQREHWLHDTAAQVDARRARARVETFERAKASSESSSSAMETEALTPEEERTIVRYHEAKIQSVCGAFALPRKVKNTAVMLFKRFAVDCGTHAHSLKIMMLTSVYVACKVEESYISAEEFCKGVREDPSRVLAAEVTFLSGLKFRLVCYGATRPLDGFLMDVEDGGCKGATSKQLIECRKKALDIVDRLMLTDAPLIRPPGQIALCALRRAARECGASELEKYCEDVGARGTTKAPRGAKLKEILDDIESHVDEGVEPDAAVVKEIDKKLKLWRAKYLAKTPAADDAGDAQKAAKRRKSEQSRQDMIAAEEDALG